MADWNLGGLNWSDTPYNVGGNEGEPGTAIYQTPGFDLSQLDWQQLGYDGEFGTNPISENGTSQSNEFDGVNSWLSNKGLRSANAWDPSGTMRYTGLFGQNNKMAGNPVVNQISDNDFGLAMQLAGSLMGGVGLDMAGWGSGFGGGWAGKAVQGATLGSISAGLGGGNPFQGAATGGLTGGLSGGLSATGYAPSQVLGIDNKLGASMLDNSASSAVRAGLSGGNPWQAAATSGITTGLNGLGSMLASQNNTGGNMNELPWNDNPAMNASYPEGYQPQRSALTEALQGPGPEMSYAPPNSPMWNNTPFTPYGLNLPSTNQGDTREQVSSASGPGMSFSLPNMGQVGNWALNNAGDLAGMLYGYMNNRKQQNQLGSMMSGLQGLYSQNSPYAQQMRRQLERSDAARGLRSQYGRREVELQAKLAGMASQQIPAMYQMQMGQNQLQNQNMMGILNTLGKTGVFKGLAGMFGGGGQFANGPTPMPGYNAPMQWGMNNRGMDMPVVSQPTYPNDNSVNGWLDSQ